MRLVEVADEIAAAVLIMSRHRIGVIIIIIIIAEPTVPIDGGVLVDAVVSRELLVTVALPEYLNHLGPAVVIRGDRVERAGVPITWAMVIDRAADLAGGCAVAIDEDTGDPDRGPDRP